VADTVGDEHLILQNSPDGDGRVGVADAVYVLGVVSGMRP